MKLDKDSARAAHGGRPVRRRGAERLSLEGLLDELVSRGYSQESLLEVDDVDAVLRMLGMDNSAGARAAAPHADR